ncbi:MAG: peptide chain release factor N(5)-glutamine methyltransferase [bacterium]
MQTWTIRKLITWTAEWFKNFDIATPRLDAEILLSHTINCTRLDLYLDPDKPVTDTERAAFRSHIKRRANREPIAYIIGSKEFWGRNFSVDPRVLIPRPETETLIEAALSKIPEKAPWLVADLGTGSGCIAITIALEKPDVKVIASDISAGSIEVAKMNAFNLGASDRIMWRQGSWCTVFNSLIQPKSLDLLLTNPPYIASGELLELQPEISKYEPDIALDGGKDGLQAYKELVQEAVFWLKSGSWIIMEIGYRQGEDIKGILKEASFVSIEIIKDASGKDRVISAMKP